MSPLVVIAAVAVGAYALMAGKSVSKSNEAPKEAQSLFAAILSPSIGIDALAQAYDVFAASAANQARGSAAQVRLSLYALVAFLKAAMLSRGAQPDADEMLMIGNAPLGGGTGLISYGDIGLDVMQSVAAGLSPTYKDAVGLGQYIQAIAQAATAAGQKQKDTAAPRTAAFLLALKAKQICLLNPMGIPAAFTDAEGIPEEAPQVFFAIANIAGKDVIATKPNSILAYS